MRSRRLALAQKKDYYIQRTGQLAKRRLQTKGRLKTLMFSDDLFITTNTA